MSKDKSMSTLSKKSQQRFEIEMDPYGQKLKQDLRKQIAKKEAELAKMVK